MPCYCDTPDEKDQIEIEKRCKDRMYFDLQQLLTYEQAKECEKQNLKQFPTQNVNEQLCALCKIVTKDQMLKITAFYYQIKWDHKNLYDWYVQHCIDDKNFNKEIAKPLKD